MFQFGFLYVSFLLRHTMVTEIQLEQRQDA